MISTTNSAPDSEKSAPKIEQKHPIPSKSVSEEKSQPFPSTPLHSIETTQKLDLSRPVSPECVVIGDIFPENITPFVWEERVEHLEGPLWLHLNRKMRSKRNLFHQIERVGESIMSFLGHYTPNIPLNILPGPASDFGDTDDEGSLVWVKKWVAVRDNLLLIMPEKTEPTSDSSASLDDIDVISLKSIQSIDPLGQDDASGEQQSIQNLCFTIKYASSATTDVTLTLRAPTLADVHIWIWFVFILFLFYLWNKGKKKKK